MSPLQRCSLTTQGNPPFRIGHGYDLHRLQPGEVFTIEPGVYIQTEKLGVRIEDDYLVMPDGTLSKLSGRIPSDPKELERLMAKR